MKAPSAKEKKREFALFLSWGGRFYVCIHVCMYVFKDVHIYLSRDDVCTSMYICRDVCMCVGVYVHMCVVCMYICV